MRRKFIIFISAFILVLLLFLSLRTHFTYDATLSRSKNAAPTPLKVGWTLYSGFYPMVIAQGLGLFEKHNVNVEPNLYELIELLARDFVSGKLDGAMATPSDFLPISIQTSLKFVLITDNSIGADQVVAAQNIRSVADLRGKKLGYIPGSFGELFVRKMLEMNNLKITDINPILILGDSVPESLPQRIDAGHTWEPYAAKAIADGNHVIFSSADIPGLIVDVVAFHTSVVEDRPEDIRAFIAAWFEAVEFWKNNPDDAAEMIAEHTGLKPEEVSKEGLKLFDLEDNKVAFIPGKSSRCLFFNVEECVDFLVARGILSKMPDLDQLITSEFLE